MSNNSAPDIAQFGWKTRLALARNRVIGSGRFQRWAARVPIFRSVARRKAAGQFDLIAGFVYTQVANAFVESGLIGFLREAPHTTDEVADFLSLPREATLRLLRAGAALELSQTPQPDLWILGEAGAALSANEGAMAMMRHHRLLYRDLTDPLALLSRRDAEGKALASFWSDSYASDNAEVAQPYSELMAATQPMVWDQVLGRYPFERHIRMLDVGGGSGAFAEAVAGHAPGLALGVFDLPGVVELARKRFAGTTLEQRVTIHPGSFRKDALPQGYDLVTLVRILHDHDDDVAQALLGKIHESLAPGGRLLIVEPMAGTRGVEKMGDAYFGLYLWALGSGRPRTFQEISKMARLAGFSRVKEVATNLPIIARIAVITK